MLIELSPVPVLGGSGGLSSLSARFRTGFLAADAGGVAIERRGGGGCGCALRASGEGSSWYECVGGDGENEESRVTD